MPRGRWPPLLFGIHTRRRGRGAYFPDANSSRSVSSQRSCLGFRSPRTSRHQPLPLPHSRGNGVCFQQNILATDLVPETIEAKGWFSLSFRSAARSVSFSTVFIGVGRLRQSPGLLSLSSLASGQGPFPPTGVTRLHRYYEPIRHLRPPTRPSRVRRW